MQVTIDVTAEDLWRYHRRLLLRHRTLRSNVLAGVVVAPLMAAVIAMAVGAPGGVTIAGAVVAVPLVVVIHLRVSKRQLQRVASEQDGVLGEHVIELSDEGLRERTPWNDTLTSWVAVRDVERDDHALYVSIGPLAAHVLPLRCFASPAEVDAFEAAVRRYAAATVPA